MAAAGWLGAGAGVVGSLGLCVAAAQAQAAQEWLTAVTTAGTGRCTTWYLVHIASISGKTTQKKLALYLAKNEDIQNTSTPQTYYAPSKEAGAEAAIRWYGVPPRGAPPYHAGHVAGPQPAVVSHIL